jgi:hypothetical protein
MVIEVGMRGRRSELTTTTELASRGVRASFAKRASSREPRRDRPLRVSERAHRSACRAALRPRRVDTDDTVRAGTTARRGASRWATREGDRPPRRSRPPPRSTRRARGVRRARAARRRGRYGADDRRCSSAGRARALRRERDARVLASPGSRCVVHRGGRRRAQRCEDARSALDGHPVRFDGARKTAGGHGSEPGGNGAPRRHPAAETLQELAQGGGRGLGASHDTGHERDSALPPDEAQGGGEWRALRAPPTPGKYLSEKIRHQKPDRSQNPREATSGPGTEVKKM